MGPRHLHRGALAHTGIAVTGVVICLHADLVGPEDLGVLPRRLLFNGGIGLLQPLLDFIRVLMMRMPHRFLGGITPATQVLPDGALRQVDADFPVDQLANGATGPQGVRDLQLLRGVVVDPLLDALGLLVGEGAA